MLWRLLINHFAACANFQSGVLDYEALFADVYSSDATTPDEHGETFGTTPLPGFEPGTSSSRRSEVS